MERFRLFFREPYNKKVTLVLFCVGLIIYANSIFNGFIADDFAQVRDNNLVHSLLNIPNLFSRGTVYDENVLRSNYYRPLLSSVFSLIYFFSAGNPFGFHLVQILVHITNSFLIYIIFKHFFERELSFLLSLLFLVHPLNTEAVVYISSLQDPLFLMFGLFTVLLVQKTNKLKSTFFLLLGMAMLLLSLLSKETGVTFLVVIPLFIYLYKKKNSNIVYVILQGFLVLFIYVILRFAVANIYFPQHPIVPIMTLNFWERSFSIPKIILFYIKTFFYPKDLLIFQSWTVKSLDFTNFYLPLIMDSVFFFLIITLGVVVYKKHEVFKSFIFFFFWFVIGLGVHLQITPLDQTVSDRWFYFPIVGLLGIIGVFLKYLNHRGHLNFNSMAIVIFVIVAALSIRVVIRNANWKDELTLYAHDVQYNKESYQLERGLGNVYFSKENITEAEKHYLNAVRLFPSSTSLYALGEFYLLTEKFDKASDNFSLALNYDPNSTYTWLLLAVSKYKSGNKEGAVAAANKAYSISPSKGILSVLKAIENDKEIKNVR